MAGQESRRHPRSQRMIQYPARSCPQFDSCSAPACPLDPEAEVRDVLPGDPECGPRRSVRERIAAKYQADLLPWRGLLPRERAKDARKAAWAAVPDSDPRKIALRANAGRLG